jgi:hypothetical protein
MNLKMSAIVAIVTASALTGISSTIPMAVYADESETSTDQENEQKNVGSGDSNSNNCAENTDPPPPGQPSSSCQFNNGGIIIGPCVANNEGIIIRCA